LQDCNKNAPSQEGAFFFAALWTLLFAALLATIFLLYQPGFDFGPSFDDDANLRGLASIHDSGSAWRFALGGEAGPLGRPVALASFLIDAHSWPDAPRDLIRTNVLIHLLNVALVVWIALRIAELLPGVGDRRAWFALTVGALWGLNPVFMSASLMTVQRMTTLSATFCLLGTLGYLCARGELARRPGRAMLAMALAVGVGTALAALSKETGALLPLLVGVLEATLVRRVWPVPADPGPRRVWVLWQCVVFGLPAIVLGVYTVQSLRIADLAFQGKDYGAGGRLLTELRVLLEYLRLLVVPTLAKLGPFHDDYLASRSLWHPPATAVAAACWAAVLALAWCLRRGRWRVLGFAVAWFLVGHSLESSVFALELYFEHRNYLPGFAVLLAVATVLWQPVAGLRWPGFVVLAVLLANMAFMARENGLLWSNPVAAGHFWADRHPRSMRAMNNYSRAIAEQGDVARALAVFETADASLRDSPEYGIARLLLYCGTRGPDEVARASEDAMRLLQQGSVDFRVPQNLGLVMDLAALGRCRGFEPDAGRRMLEAMLALPPQRLLPRAVPVVHENLARYWARHRQLDATMHHLELEYARTRSLDALERMVSVLVSAGLCAEALERLDTAALKPPRLPWSRWAWERRITTLRMRMEATCHAPADVSAGAGAPLEGR